MNTSACIALCLWASISTAHVDVDVPPDSAYVVAGDDGQLYADGQRVRYWGVIGSFPNVPNLEKLDDPDDRRVAIDRAYADVEAFIDRFEALGFNLVRAFHGFPEPTDYEPGDGSRADIIDHFYTRLFERGFRVWCSAFNRTGSVGPEDVVVIDDPATADDWAEAIGSMKGGRMNLRKCLADFWDPRLEALVIRRMTAIAEHRNRHNGLRWADDPVFAVWELSNEEWWISKMVSGRWQNLPPFFQRELIETWHKFLIEKYGDEEAIIDAWTGLLPGESLAEGTILLAPLRETTTPSQLNDANKLAQFAGVDQPYGRRDFSGRRGEDVLEFLVSLHLGHKQRIAEALKPLGRSLTLSPMIYDTGIGYEAQAQYLHQNADALAHDAYINGQAKYDGDGRWPWDSGLDEEPRINEGLPWLEQNSTPGKPFFCYETQIMQPAKYRSEFPIRIAALASIQDWDIVCWHYWGAVPDITTSERPFDKAMDVTTGGHPQGYHYTYDEVQNAAIRLASTIWRNGHLDPAPNPTTFIYGRRTLYDPASMDYGMSYGRTGLNMLPTTYKHGVRIVIDPTREDDEVIGPMLKALDRSRPSPIRPTDQIAYHWRKGSLMFDATSVAAYTGFLADWGDTVRFEEADVTLRDVAIVNPSGIAFPVTEDEGYVTFALATTDGRPLDEADAARLCLVSTSFNTEFELGMVTGRRNQRGSIPVLVARVSATLDAPVLDGMRYTFLDWHGQPIGSGLVAGGSLTIPADLPIWTVELTR